MYSVLVCIFRSEYVKLHVVSDSVTYHIKIIFTFNTPNVLVMYSMNVCEV